MAFIVSIITSILAWIISTKFIKLNETNRQLCVTSNPKELCQQQKDLSDDIATITIIFNSILTITQCLILIVLLIWRFIKYQSFAKMLIS